MLYQKLPYPVIFCLAASLPIEIVGTPDALGISLSPNPSSTPSLAPTFGVGNTSPRVPLYCECFSVGFINAHLSQDPFEVNIPDPTPIPSVVTNYRTIFATGAGILVIIVIASVL